MAEALPTSAADLQQYFYESFGDRDWDVYKHNEHIFLKRNIGYALYGPPVQFEQNPNGAINLSTGYDERQNASIEEIYQAIIRNHFIEDSAITLVRTIFICCELKDENLSVIPVPVFVVKRCHFVDEPFPKKCITNGNNEIYETCNIFIDTHGRVYQSWQLFLENNRLPKSTMVCPKNGKYTGEIVGGNEVQVILERHESAACSLGNNILEVTDTTGTIVSVASTLTFVAAVIPGVAVAPALLAASAVGGLGVGLYSVGRSVHTLVDRSKHEQSIGLDNSESRWCWLNTAVGVLGASASAATAAMTQAVRGGAKISQTARVAFNTLNIANMVGSATNLGFAGYNIIDKLMNNETVSPLEYFQFASSVLFFHKSVVGFRYASTIISETQTAQLKSYEQSLRSNRHRRLFRKAQLEARRLRGETAGNAEVLSGIQNINDPDNFFAGLARINKDLNKNNARYVITTDGKVEINSAYIVDPMEFYTVGKENRVNILRSLPSRLPGPSYKMSQETFITKSSFISNCCQEVIVRGASNLVHEIARQLLTNRFDIETITFLLKDFADNVVRNLITLLVRLLSETTEQLQANANKLHPMVPFSVFILQYIINYLKNNAETIGVDFSTFLNTCFNHDDSINMQFMYKLADDFKMWINNKIEALQTITEIDFDPVIKVRKNCIVCSGVFYITAS